MELLRSSVLVVLLASAAASLSRVEPKAPWVKDPFGCNLPCWETCLAKPGSYSNAYSSVFRPLVSAARDLRANNPGSKGTIFIIDSTATPFVKFVYQQTLAAIVALTMPVEFNDFSPASSCNPFFFSQYIEFGGFSPPFGQCLDHCDAASHLLGLFAFPEGFIPPDPDALGGGCFFGHFAANNPNSLFFPCADPRFSKNELAIAFVNSKDQSQNIQGSLSTCNAPLFPVASRKLLVRTGSGPTLPAYFPNEVKAGDHWLLPAAQQLLGCMMKTCCHRRMEDVGPAEMGEVEYMMQKPGEEAEDAGKGREPTIQRGTMKEICDKFMGGRMPESAAPKKEGGSVITERAK